MLLYTLFYLLFVKEIISQSLLDQEPGDTQYEIQLQKDLLANYDDSEPPNKNNTIVAVKFTLKNFEFSQSEAFFNIYSWMFFQWQDPRLSWNPNDYARIDKVILHNINIWSPLGYLQNLADVTNSEDFYHFTYCQVTNTGNVMCVLRVFHQTACLAKLFDWPYDFQICNFTFGIRKGEKGNVTFTFNGTRGISMLGTEYGPGWNIMDYAVGENTTGEAKLYLKFLVERQAEGMAVVVVIPLMLVSLMTVSSMFLDVRNVNRLGLASFSLYGHLMASDNIGGNIPHYGGDIPRVLIFTRTSILITLFAIFLTIILNFLTKRNWKCYEWIKLFNNFVLKTSLRFVIFPKWQVEGKVTSEPEHTDRQTWLDLASIVNTVYMIITVVIYIVLYSCYLPKPIPIDHEYDLL